MERYIGMDVHAASCTLAVISEKGRKLRDFPVETNGQALVEACAIAAARCEACLKINAFDDLNLDCDQADDQFANESCP